MTNDYTNLKIKCNTCLGCNLLEDKNFKGYYRCENYVKGAEDNGSRRINEIHAKSIQ